MKYSAYQKAKTDERSLAKHGVPSVDESKELVSSKSKDILAMTGVTIAGGSNDNEKNPNKSIEGQVVTEVSKNVANSLLAAGKGAGGKLLNEFKA